MEGANNMMNKQELKDSMKKYCKVKYGKSLEKAGSYQVWNCLSSALLEGIVDNWEKTEETYKQNKMAYYISAEYLMGRALGNNLISLQIYDQVKELLEDMQIDLNQVEEIEEDAGLGNGGLGRLAACFMDSGAVMNLPLRGYGIRYSNGLFTQRIVEGQQIECADEWLRYGDPWSIRKDDLAVNVVFDDFTVRAVPYDTPIIAYGSKNVNTLRLWKAEPLVAFDFELFNNQDYDKAVKAKNRADDISRVLYPNDSLEKGKLLRLRQQYFMVSASLKDMVRSYKEKHGEKFDHFSEWHAIQLNDTHPVIAIPEFIRILVDEEHIVFEEALSIAKQVFAYTNHTILQEALEKWELELINKLFVRIGEIIEMIDAYFMTEIEEKELEEKERDGFRIIQDDLVHMANLAIHVGFAVNGVAGLHTEILKETELHNWYEMYPQKFQNKTNGITPRRWLRLCNQELSAFITELLGSEGWVTDLGQLKALEKYSEDEQVLKRMMAIKHVKKVQLAQYIKEVQGIEIDPFSVFDIQIKRLHEYKRQLLNAFYILDLYYQIKENPGKDMPPVTFIFGAKAFPGYARAKAIIKFIGEIQKLVNHDETVNKKMKVVFIENYRVSFGEKLFPAADVSKQISMAGKEASGTGNMKFMLNGAPTFGTYDGANVEIVKESKEENNFIFGLRIEHIDSIDGRYNPKLLYRRNKDIKKVVDSLVNGTFDDGGTGEFKELFNSLLKGTSWHEPDQYYLLADFKAFKKTQEKVFKDYQDELTWARMCLMNIANAGIFSSDRTIMQYANEIWGIKPISVEL